MTLLLGGPRQHTVRSLRGGVLLSQRGGTDRPMIAPFPFLHRSLRTFSRSHAEVVMTRSVQRSWVVHRRRRPPRARAARCAP